MNEEEVRSAILDVLSQPRVCSEYCKPSNEQWKAAGAEKIVKVFDDPLGQVDAMRSRVVTTQRRNRALTDENRGRAEYTNQLHRQIAWLVSELREARTELRLVRKHNRMLIEAQRRHREQGCEVIVSHTSISAPSTEKE